MNVKTTISTTEARKRFFEIIEKVKSPAIVYTLTKYGRPQAVIMSAEEYESLIETLEVMSDFPDIRKRKKKSRGSRKDKTRRALS